MPFRLESITTEVRMELGMLCLLKSGEYGLVQDLARSLGVSWQFLYAVRDRARGALEAAFTPGSPGRPSRTTALSVDRRRRERAVLVLSQAGHASVRGIQDCLSEILEVEVSGGWVEGVLQEAARRAQALPQVPTGPLEVDADELFARGEPVLAVVDQESGRVLALEPAPSRDETAWGCIFLDLEAAGIAIERVTADGATGLRAGVRAAGLSDPGLDHWHTLRDLGRIERSLNADADRKLKVWEKKARAVSEETDRVETGKRRVGRPRKEASDGPSAETALPPAEAALERAEGATYVLDAVKDSLRLLDPETGRIHRPEATRSEIATALSLLGEIGGGADRAARILTLRLDRLIAYQEEVERALVGPRGRLDEAEVAFLAWAWRHPSALGLTDAAQARAGDPDAARSVWQTLDRAKRGSGRVENLNSVLAFHRATHRGLPKPVLDVFQVYRNHRVFSRGKRSGHSPLELSGLPSPHWLEVLGYGREPKSTPTRNSPTHQPLSTH